MPFVIPQAAQSPYLSKYILNIYTDYLTVIILNNEIIQKILAVYVKNISNLLIECICCVSEFS
jgi:hypothetical protein